jgi:hypothetical protein
LPRAAGCPPSSPSSARLIRITSAGAGRCPSGCGAEELGERRARLERRRLAAADPVLALREKVESTTLGAVRAYVPRPFAGRLCLLLAGSSWERSGVEALRWESLAAQCDVLRGPDASTGSDMLRTHAAAFAELFRRC